MNRAWIVNNEGSLEIFYGMEPELDEETGCYRGPSFDPVSDEYMPLSGEILRLKPGESPIEVMIAPVECVRSTMNDEFFTTLASKMRVLWPQGDKEGKWAWRDSVPNLAKRLKTLWEIRKLRSFNIEDCLIVCRKYLSQYENDVKYMQVLKYFILKQKEIVGSDGRIKYLSSSRFADMLEGKVIDDAAQDFESVMSGFNNDNLI